MERHSGWKQRSQRCTYQTKAQVFCWSNVHFLWFLAQTNPFCLSVISGFAAAVWLVSPDLHSFLWIVDLSMCLLLELWEAFIWAPIWGAVSQIRALSEAADSDGFTLCSRSHHCSSFSAAVLMWLFCIFPDWISFIFIWPHCFSVFRTNLTESKIKKIALNEKECLHFCLVVFIMMKEWRLSVRKQTIKRLNTFVTSCIIRFLIVILRFLKNPFVHKNTQAVFESRVCVPNRLFSPDSCLWVITIEELLQWTIISSPAWITFSTYLIVNKNKIKISAHPGWPFISLFVFFQVPGQ